MTVLSRIWRHFVPGGFQKVSATLTIKYDIRNTVSNSLILKYDILNLVNNTLTTVYDIRQLATNTLTLTYDIAGTVSKSLTLLYTIVAGTASTSIPAKSSGFKLPTIDEPTEKKLLKQEIKIPISATLACPETVNVPTTSRLVAPMEGTLTAKSESLLKRQELLGVSARLRKETNLKIKTESSLTQGLQTAKVEARISLKPLIEFIQRNLKILSGQIQSFAFRESSVYFEDILHFKEPSSFVGLVTYDTETQQMSIFLGGDNRYDFCGVPARVYDGFKGAPSKGAYFGRNIRGQFNC